MGPPGASFAAASLYTEMGFYVAYPFGLFLDSKKVGEIALPK